MLNKLSSKQISSCLFTSKEVIEYQSMIYYPSQSYLGFNTLVESEIRYTELIAQIIMNYMEFFGNKKKIDILELGPGTGKFFQKLNKILESKQLINNYTMVDIVTDKISDLKNTFKIVKIIKNNFSEFSLKNTKIFDVLIANEALDMWAGIDTSYPKPEFNNRNTTSIKAFWILRSLSNGRVISKNNIRKIKKSPNNYVWERVYYLSEENQFKTYQKEFFFDKIKIPVEITHLLKNINFLAIFQDYWSFNEPNALRMQLTSSILDKINIQWNAIEDNYSLVSTLKKNVAEFYKQKAKTGNDQIWIKSSIIPFGIVDITYSPNQIEFLNIIEQLGFQVSHIPIENTQKDEYFPSIGNKEIIILQKLI